MNGDVLMVKNCFVIMGYGIKNKLNLDLTYNEIIKPCLVETGLVPYPLYNDDKFNAFRCDEIIGTTIIDYKYVICLSEADIVIADISTLNANAIYELGARHALKPKSTIVLCAKEKGKEFNFFDLNHNPILFYEHKGNYLTKDTINKTKTKLKNLIFQAIYSETEFPDNVIHMVLSNKPSHYNSMIINNNGTYLQKPTGSIYKNYTEGLQALDEKNFCLAENYFNKLLQEDNNEENILLLTLAKYKKAEQEENPTELLECLSIINNNIDLSNSNSEILFGRLAAINLRLFNLGYGTKYYYDALENYHKGSTLDTEDLYCSRNYCATLVRVYEITKDKNNILEYYYTAVHHAKIFKEKKIQTTNFTPQKSAYYEANIRDFNAIINCGYLNYEKDVAKIKSNILISDLQKKTIIDGMIKLQEDLTYIRNEIKPYLTINN
jgi:hypothetical protein